MRRSAGKSYRRLRLCFATVIAKGMAFISAWSIAKTKKKILWITSTGGGARFIVNLKNYEAIPGAPIAYWASKGLITAFEKGVSLGEIAEPKQGLATGNNDLFLRRWYEVGQQNVYYCATDIIHAFATGKKWFPCTKGGSYRKWYGNNDYFVNWLENGKEIKSYKNKSGEIACRAQNTSYYFEEGGTWSTLSGADLSMRYLPKGFIFETKGSVCFAKEQDDLLYIIGLLNTKVTKQALLVLSPTLDYHEGPLSRVPVTIAAEKKPRVDEFVGENIALSRCDWDSEETSWDFKKHPLI